MDNKKAQRTTKGAPKRAVSRLSIGTLIVFLFFVFTVLLFVPGTLPYFVNLASAQGLILLYFWPLSLSALILVPFCSYYSGLAFGKIAYKISHQCGLFLSFLIAIIIQLICFAICFHREIAMFGDPIEMCFGTCSYVKSSDAIGPYLIATTIFFLPAYYAMCRYSFWVKKYKILGKPTTSRH